MNLKGLITGLVVLTTALFWAGCETTGPEKHVICTSDEIRPGDSLSISFLDIPEQVSDKEFQVRGDGTINMPLIGSVKVLGKKFGDLERELQGMYVPKYYTRLTVVIKPRERFYSVGGEVKAPGRQVYIGETTILRAIVTAGDFNEFANKRKVQIIRANGEQEIVDCKKARENPKKFDRPICPGDAIFVPRSL